MIFKKSIGIYPWVANELAEGDKHQLLFSEALKEQGYNTKRITYKRGFPVRHALKHEIDILILDWVHSFYTSQKLVNTIVKAVLGYFDLLFLNKKETIIIWNLHNLKRHDGKFSWIEKICFKKLAKKVDYIRVFDENHIDKVCDYFGVSSSKIIAIQQGPYLYKDNIEVDLYSRYSIPRDHKISLFFGSIRKGKGLENFIETFKQLSVNNCTLLIAGKAFDPILGEEIKKMIGDNTNIVFDNCFVPDNEVKSYFQNANHIVLPYLNTLNSGVLLLAKSYGTPILANNNFKDAKGECVIIGDLFDEIELENCLKKILKVSNSNNRINTDLVSWQSVINSFERYFNG